MPLSLEFNRFIPLSTYRAAHYIDVLVAVRAGILEIKSLTEGLENPNTLLLPNTVEGRDFKRYLEFMLDGWEGIDLKSIEIGSIKGLPSYMEEKSWIVLALFDKNKNPAEYPLSANIKLIY